IELGDLREFVELIQVERVCSQIDLGGMVDGGEADEQAVAGFGGGDGDVGAGKAGEFGGCLILNKVELLLGAFQSKCDQFSVGQEVELFERAGELGAEAFRFGAGRIR